MGIFYEKEYIYFKIECLKQESLRCWAWEHRTAEEIWVFNVLCFGGSKSTEQVMKLVSRTWVMAAPTT